jgi:hypothetical protein
MKEETKQQTTYETPVVEVVEVEVEQGFQASGDPRDYGYGDHFSN